MDRLLLQVLKMSFFVATAFLLAGAGLWAFLRVGVIIALAGPFFGLALLGYTLYYLNSLL